jgi:hypothetical protein
MNKNITVVRSSHNDIEKALDTLNDYYDSLNVIKRAILELDDFKPSFNFSIDRNTKLSRDQLDKLVELTNLASDIKSIDTHFAAILTTINKKCYRLSKQLEISKLFKPIE